MHVSDVTQDTGWGGWGGGGDVMTFLARAHMLDATPACGGSTVFICSTS